mgnify:CR=1 FL=1
MSYFCKDCKFSNETTMIEYIKGDIGGDYSGNGGFRL